MNQLEKTIDRYLDSIAEKIESAEDRIRLITRQGINPLALAKALRDRISDQQRAADVYMTIVKLDAIRRFSRIVNGDSKALIRSQFDYDNAKVTNADTVSTMGGPLSIRVDPDKGFFYRDHYNSFGKAPLTIYAGNTVQRGSVLDGGYNFIEGADDGYQGKVTIREPGASGFVTAVPSLGNPDIPVFVHITNFVEGISTAPRQNLTLNSNGDNLNIIHTTGIMTIHGSAEADGRINNWPISMKNFDVKGFLVSGSPKRGNGATIAAPDKALKSFSSKVVSIGSDKADSIKELVSVGSSVFGSNSNLKMVTGLFSKKDDATLNNVLVEFYDMVTGSKRGQSFSLTDITLPVGDTEILDVFNMHRRAQNIDEYLITVLVKTVDANEDKIYTTFDFVVEMNVGTMNPKRVARSSVLLARPGKTVELMTVTKDEEFLFSPVYNSGGFGNNFESLDVCKLSKVAAGKTKVENFNYNFVNGVITRHSGNYGDSEVDYGMSDSAKSISAIMQYQPDQVAMRGSEYNLLFVKDADGSGISRVRRYGNYTVSDSTTAWKTPSDDDVNIAAGSKMIAAGAGSALATIDSADRLTIFCQRYNNTEWAKFPFAVEGVKDVKFLRSQTYDRDNLLAITAESDVPGSDLLIVATIPAVNTTKVDQVFVPIIIERRQIPENAKIAPVRRAKADESVSFVVYKDGDEKYEMELITPVVDDSQYSWLALAFPKSHTASPLGIPGSGPAVSAGGDQ